MNLEELRDGCLGRDANNYFLESVDIISPYLSSSFFEKIKDIKPKSIFIVTDAGCSSDVLADVRKTLAEKPKIKLDAIKLAQCTGIVHAKCYLFHWKNKATNRLKRVLLWGSCNASDGGFKNNAEVFSWIFLQKIDKESRSEVLKYFNALRNNSDHVAGLELSISDFLIIKLPEIKFHADKFATFDLWIQKGRFCHPFPSDQNFRRLKLILKNKIESKNDFSRALSENNIDISQQRTITYDYLRKNNDQVDKFDEIEVDDDVSSIWKAQYFTDTVYGLWTSGECFREKRAYFHKRDKTKREDEINLISKDDGQQRDKWRDEFIFIIESISKSVVDPEDYFHYKAGVLDIDRYKDQFDKQLKRDFLRAQNPWFRHGYTSGFDFPEVPPIREFSSNWDELLSSFIASLLFEMDKERRKNKLAQTIRKYTDFNEYINNGDEPLDILRTYWDEFKENIEEFYS